MIKSCGGHGNRFHHLWVEAYIRYPRNRTLILMWTRGMWRYASVSGIPFKTLTGTL